MLKSLGILIIILVILLTRGTIYEYKHTISKTALFEAMRFIDIQMFLYYDQKYLNENGSYYTLENKNSHWFANGVIKKRNCYVKRNRINIY